MILTRQNVGMLQVGCIMRRYQRDQPHLYQDIIILQKLHEKARSYAMKSKAIPYYKTLMIYPVKAHRTMNSLFYVGDKFVGFRPVVWLC
jgi:hypothetical protein